MCEAGVMNLREEHVSREFPPFTGKPSEDGMRHECWRWGGGGGAGSMWTFSRWVDMGRDSGSVIGFQARLGHLDSARLPAPSLISLIKESY